MDVLGTWRRLSSWRPQSAAAGTESEPGAPSPLELRQRHLARLRSHGIPHWSEVPERCDACGRELLPGEQPLLLRRSDALLLACPLCAERLYAEGCLRVSVAALTDAEAAAQLPLAV